MAISDIPIFSMLRTRMQWHQERQRFWRRTSPIPTRRTSVRAIWSSRNSSCPRRAWRPLQLDANRCRPISPALATRPAFGATATSTRSGPAGNAVNLEDEMIKVAQNKMDYQAATALYSRSLGLIKTALGKK